VSIFIDLIGSARGSGTGRGGGGQRTHGRGMIVPCALAAMAEIKSVRENKKRLKALLRRGITLSSLTLPIVDFHLVSTIVNSVCILKLMSVFALL
jgi:hypothetical protein